MKKATFKLFTVLITIIIGAAMIFSACEGPEGAAGADGMDGSNGSDGTDGVDGNVTCLACHTLANMDQIEASFAMSSHGQGNYAGYAGGRNGCAKCHSHQGFMETTATGRDTTATGFSIPLAFTCETCHSGHVSFDFENDGPDYALRTTAPVPLLMDGNTTVVDFGNNGNLCLICHQPRRPAPVDDGEGNFNITSSHYGPHHGPQGTLLEGVGGYEFAGPEAYPTTTTSHRTAGCTTCHMAEADATTGGHTFLPNISGCTACHADATSMDINGKMTEMENLLDELAVILVEKGVLSGDHGDYHVVKGVFPVEVAAAFYNWDMVFEDRSNGVHHVAYTTALIKNTLDAMK